MKCRLHDLPTCFVRLLIIPREQSWCVGVCNNAVTVQENRVSHHQANPGSSPRPTLLKRMDQAVVATLGVAGLVAVGVYCLVHGGSSGRLIEIDRSSRHTASFQIDINQADWPEFSVLPEIGETLARRIVESRAVDGPFADLDQLRRVRGIGPKTLERIKPYLRPVPPSGTVAGQ